jgi:hypothetical protein
MAPWFTQPEWIDLQACAYPQMGPHLAVAARFALLTADGP